MPTKRHLVIVFRSRTEVYSFTEALNARGASAYITATPLKAGVGCGVAVKTRANNFSAVLAEISSGSYAGFYGVFSVETRGVRSSVTRVV